MSPTSSSPGDRFSFTFDPADEVQPSMAIVEAVAWVKGIDLRDLQPLDDVISTHELNRQFSRSGDTDFYRSASQPTNPGPRMTFTYEDCTVSVSGHRIEVAPKPH